MSSVSRVRSLQTNYRTGLLYPTCLPIFLGMISSCSKYMFQVHVVALEKPARRATHTCTHRAHTKYTYRELRGTGSCTRNLVCWALGRCVITPSFRYFIYLPRVCSHFFPLPCHCLPKHLPVSPRHIQRNQTHSTKLNSTEPRQNPPQQIPPIDRSLLSTLIILFSNPVTASSSAMTRLCLLLPLPYPSLRSATLRLSIILL